MLKKFLTMILCVIFSALLFTGCDDNDKSSNEESYYGMAIKEVNGKEIYLIYDCMYISDDEINVLKEYYCSIQEKDAKRFESTVPEEYISFICKNSSTDIESIVESEYNTIEEELGKEFDLTQIEVTDCISGGESSSIKEMLDGIYSDAGKEKSFSDTIKEEKYITYNVTAVDSGGETYYLTGQTKYIFNCEDGIYIF